jgi:D-lyxose ketol-isomerase
MIRKSEYRLAQKRAAELLCKSGISLHPEELDKIEVVDFGLGELEMSGAQILPLVATQKIAVKLLALFPSQTTPEHIHPSIDDYPGKEETIRCEWGELFLYGPGSRTPNPKGCPPVHRKHTYTVWHEYHLFPGGHVTFEPGVPHWFQAGPKGVVVWSFSTKAIDAEDRFTDPEIQRETTIVDD